MRVLVDESLPVDLAAELPGHEVRTVRSQQWLGMRNGVLLRAAADAGFEVLLTADRALRYQQNLATFNISVVLVTGVRNRLQDLRPLIARILTAIVEVQPGDVLLVTGS